MTIEEMKISFWDVVSECLVEFHGLNHAEAYEKSTKLRGSLRELDRPKDLVYPSDIVYHEEPFYIACSLMDLRLKLEGPEYRKQYQAILKRHGW
jgi:hypothetical protein